MELRPDDIQEILRIFAESELEELRLELGDTRLHVSKRGGSGPHEPAPFARPSGSAPPAPAASASAPAASTPSQAPAGDAASTPPPPADAAVRVTADADAPVEGLVELRSPLLGVFYRRPTPNDPAFVEVGSVVDAEDPVCIVDVMKMFTQVPAGVAGRIAQICVEDGQLVEHGQVLMRIEPA